MNNERVILTMKEQRINNILVKLIVGEIKTTEASRLTGLSERQIYRKKKLIDNMVLTLYHIKVETDLLVEVILTI